MSHIFKQLVNAASRIHTDESRSIILSDLSQITSQEYKELSEGTFLTKSQVELREIEIKRLEAYIKHLENDAA